MTANVAEAMQLINYWSSLTSMPVIGEYVISSSRLAVIQSKCSTKREIANEYASYYVHYHPQPSWTHLIRHLYSEGEFAAVEESKPFLPLRGKCNVRCYTGVFLARDWELESLGEVAKVHCV